MPPAAAQLVDDLVEEVLLRFPPKDPAALVRAALVCKRWRRLVSGPRFRRRFREFHRTPPMLGMLCNSDRGAVVRFVPTTAFLSHHAKLCARRALDARHGRVLLRGKNNRALVVWDPITDDEWKVPFPPQCPGVLSWTAAVLCSAAAGAGGCDHLDCHGRPFVVVFVASGIGPDAGLTFIYTYSSDAAAWSDPTWGDCCYLVDSGRSALVRNTLYFGNMAPSSTALKYNLQLRQMSWIQLPSQWCSALTATEDGGLRLAVEQDCKLYIWSTKNADEVDARWEQNRVIKLNTLLPVDADFTSLSVVGSTDDLSTIFVSVKDVAYAIDLETYKAKKVYEGTTKTIFPYMSFYTPALQADDTCDGGSSA